MNHLIVFRHAKRWAVCLFSLLILSGIGGDAWALALPGDTETPGTEPVVATVAETPAEPAVEPAAAEKIQTKSSPSDSGKDNVLILHKKAGSPPVPPEAGKKE